MTFDTTILNNNTTLHLRGETAQQTIEIVAGEKLAIIAEKHEMPTADELAILEDPYILKKLVDRVCKGIKTVTACQ